MWSPLTEKQILRHSPKTICLLALSDIPGDPRVRRQGDAFHAAGWNVVGLGMDGQQSKCWSWPIATSQFTPVSSCIDSPPPAGETVGSRRFPFVDPYLRKCRSLRWLWQTGQRLEARFWQGAGRLKAISWIVFFIRLVRVLWIRLQPTYALRLYWSHANLHSMYCSGTELHADVWVANDWIMLPLAARLAKETGGVYAYDAHEFAVNEYAESRNWRWLERPFVRAIEGQFISGAEKISTVSAGIAKELYALYELGEAPLVIRNTPVFHHVPFRHTGKLIRILYHGIVVPNRGLEATIESVPAWRSEFTLTIRGPGNPEYLKLLRERIAALQLDDRVALIPPVAMTELVRAATAFDVGVFALPPHSLQNLYTLPNKFFEYIMAGLTLCVTDLPEMADLVARYDLGVLISNVRPDSIAAAINQLDRETIDKYKRNALSAARDLSWDRESTRMIQAYEELVATCT